MKSIKNWNIYRAIAVGCLLLLLLGAADPAKPMRLGPGDAAPDFTLNDLDGKPVLLSDLTKAGKIVVLEWYSPECPISTAYHLAPADKPRGYLEATYEALKGDDFAWLAINSVSPDMDGNSLDDNIALREGAKVPYPMLFDSDFAVAKAYGARKTPDIFIIAADGTLAYCGAVDEGDFKDYPKGRNYIEETVTALRAGKPVAPNSTEPFGCGL